VLAERAVVDQYFVGAEPAEVRCAVRLARGGDDGSAGQDAELQHRLTDGGGGAPDEQAPGSWSAAAELEIPLRDRNVLLLAAGYAPRFGEASVDATALAPARAALARLLASQEPFPASLAPRIANFPEWSGYLLRRLRRQIDVTGDPALVELDREVRGYPDVGAAGPDGPHDIFVPLQIRFRDTDITLLNTLTVFGAPLDVSLADLVLESFHPADAHTAEVLRQAADERAGRPVG